MRLGTALLRDAVITLTQLEAALRAQVIYGGKLGTNLVELGYVDVGTLGTYLSRALKVPVASKERFESVDRRLVREFGAELADRYTAYPLGMEHNRPDTLAVALADPKNQQTLDGLAEATGHKIAAYVAAEMRILFYLEREFGITREARYVRTAESKPKRAQTPVHDSDRRRSQPAGGLETAGSVTFAPKKKAEPAKVTHPEPEVAYREILEAIEDSDGREDIADAIMAYAAGRFGALALMLVRDGNANGWRAFTDAGNPKSEDIDLMNLPLGGSSVLQEAFDRKRTFRGRSPSAGRPVERELWEGLGLGDDLPDEMVVVPVIVKDRVVNLIYAHGLGGAPVAEHQLSQLEEIAKRAADVYTTLLGNMRADDEE